jgi:hypothetical protein
MHTTTLYNFLPSPDFPDLKVEIFSKSRHKLMNRRAWVRKKMRVLQSKEWGKVE